MFKNRTSERPAVQVDTLIGPQLVVHGDVKFSGGLHIEGRIVGKVAVEDGQGGTLTLAGSGNIEGEVRVPTVVIDGYLTGDVYASERVELAANARVHGNVHYRVIEMIAGAVVSGRLVHVDARGSFDNDAAHSASDAT